MQQSALSRAIIGAGGGSEKPRTPIEAPDSLRSIAYARILDMVGEGEIYGLANRDNPMSCVFFNETPVANDDGSYNFKNFTVETRTGTQNQDFISGFEGVESELGINVELRADVPWVHTITNQNVTSARVRLSVPVLTKSNPENGDVNGSYVSYRIEVATDGGSYETVLNGAFRGKTTTKYERSHRIDLPPSTVSGWSIRVTRFTPNSDSVGLQNATYVESIAEIIDAKLRMPMTALVACVVDAEQFSNIPSRAYLMQGRIIRVPSNYDPDTRTYTGVWDGTFVPQYSNNPAWCFYDIVTNQRYGLGHLVPESLVDKWSLYKIGVYCDQLVSDGKGGFEPRFTTNLFLQTQAEALRVVQDMATMFRGIVYAAGGTVTPVADMPEIPAYTYNPTNVVDGRFTYGGSSRKVRHTVALVSWNDPKDFSRAKVEYVEDEEGMARYGYQPTSVIATGCTSQSQARRFGRYVLATARFETDGVEFSVGLDGTIVAPGKVALICDPLRAGRRTGGRVVDATATDITVDILPIVSTGDTLTCILPSGAAQTRDVVLINGRTITVSPAFDAVPVAQSVWAVESTELSAQRVRILAVRERSDGKGYDLTAIQQVEGKYAYADEGVPIDEPPIGAGQPPAVPSPVNITATQRDVTDQYTSVITVDVAWEPVSIATGYTVQWRQNDGEWSAIMRTSSTTVEVPNLRAGTLDVQITAFDAKGRESLPAFGGPFNIGAVSTPPGVIVDIITNQEVLEQIGLDNQAAIAQEIIDRQLTDAKLAITDANLAIAEAQLAVVQGQVGDILDADEWSASVTYPLGDLVQSGGKLYRSLIDGNINHQPAGVTDAYWEFIGNYASLGAAVGAVAAQAAANTTAVNNLDGELTALTSTVNQQATEIAGKASNAAVQLLTTRVSTAEGNITANTNNITSLNSQIASKADASALTALTTRVTATEGSITANSNSITNLTASLGSVETSIMRVRNPSFEDSTGWVMPADTAYFRTPGNRVKSGTSSLQISPNPTVVRTVYNTLRTAATDSQRFIARAQVRDFGVNAGVAIRVGIRCFDAAGTYMTTVVAGEYVATGSSSFYVQIGGPVNLTAGTAWIEGAIYTLTSAITAGQFYADDFELYPEDAATASALSSLSTRVTSAEGNITANTNAITALTSTVAGKASTSALNALTARVSAAEGSITANSDSITSLNSALAGKASTSALNSLSTLVSEIDGEVNANSAAITQVSSQVGQDPENLVLTSNFDDGTIGAWQAGTISTAGSPARNVLRVTEANGYVYENGGNRWLTCEPGDIFDMSAMLRTCQFRINFYDAAKAFLSSGSVLNSGPTGYVTVTGSTTAPANAAFYRIAVRYPVELYPGEPLSYGRNFRVVRRRPAEIANATATQTLTTSVNNVTGKINAAYTLILDVNGYVSGFKSENTGTTSTFSIVADKFQLVSPGGGSRTEYSNGNWRVYDAAGVLRVAMGINI